jgi:hypothetical protein
LDGESVFRQSRQFDWRLRCDYTGERASFAAMARYVWRGQNRVYSESGYVTPKLFGNEFMVMTEYTQLFGGNGSLRPLPIQTDCRRRNYDRDRFCSSNVFLRAKVGRHLSEQFSASVGAKLYTGSADDGDVDISGFRLTLALTGAF